MIGMLGEGYGVLLCLFTLLSLLLLFRTRHCYLPLSIILLGELMAISLRDAPVLVPLMIFIVYQFAGHVVLNNEKGSKDGLYLSLICMLAVLVAISARYILHFGYVFSAILSLGVGYYALFFSPPGGRERAFRLWKLLTATVVPLGLIEQFGLQEWSVPFVVFHYTLMLCWIKQERILKAV
jgi:hypothetical protein